MEGRGRRTASARDDIKQMQNAPIPALLKRFQHHRVAIE